MNKQIENLKQSMNVPYRLLKGHHEDPIQSGGGCINDLVSIYSGYATYSEGRWINVTDRPPCVCPVILAYTIGLNDLLPDNERQRLLDYLPRIAGSNSPADVHRRTEIIAMHSVNVILPIALRVSGLHDMALACERAGGLRAAQKAASASAKTAFASGNAAANAANAAARAANAAANATDAAKNAATYAVAYAVKSAAANATDAAKNAATYAVAYAVKSAAESAAAYAAMYTAGYTASAATNAASAVGYAAYTAANAAAFDGLDKMLAVGNCGDDDFIASAALAAERNALLESAIAELEALEAER